APRCRLGARTRLLADIALRSRREIRPRAVAGCSGDCSMVSWGTSAEDSAPIYVAVPDPASVHDTERRRRMERGLEYMRLVPGTPLSSIEVQHVFIGSCTNARIEDLRSAAQVVKGRRTVVHAIVVPGSSSVKRQAEAEGLNRIFLEAGFEWRDSGCSMFGGSNGDIA